MANASVKKIHELLKMQLSIPEYQRPYKWTRRNMADLLEDMDEAIAVGREFAKPDSSYAYRIGTIILHKKGKKYDIVDGQQRIISLLLLSRFLHNNVDMPYNFVEEVNLANKDTQEHLRDNYLFISDWFGTKSSKKDIRKEFIKSYVSIFEAVVITVENLREAFQLFDSQNSRGRSLNPSDLLKAYHLRVMRDKLQIQRDVEKWGKIDYKRINTLLSTYLYRIINWSDRRKVSPFTKNDIDVLKACLHLQIMPMSVGQQKRCQFSR